MSREASLYIIGLGIIYVMLAGAFWPREDKKLSDEELLYAALDAIFWPFTALRWLTLRLLWLPALFLKVWLCDSEDDESDKPLSQ